MQGKDKDIYCTTFCNNGHDLVDGVPVDHECYVLPVEMLAAEKRGDYKLATDILNTKRCSLKVHRGRRLKKEGK